MEMISSYSWQEAIADGALYRLWIDDDCIGTLKPVLATVGVWSEIEPVERARIYHDYVTWRQYIEPTLPEEDRLFVTIAANGKRVWVIEDDVVTMMYPSEY